METKTITTLRPEVTPGGVVDGAGTVAGDVARGKEVR